MICYLTSSPTYYPNTALNPANGFVENLKRDLPPVLKCAFVASAPDNPDGTDAYANEMRMCFEAAGFKFEDFRVLDGRNAKDASDIIQNTNFVILAGGHVPTQNLFFNAICLKDVLSAYDGIVMGISAGTMNSAGCVYAMPELDGEAVDPHFERSLPGLGLTDINIIPHYQYLETCMLDGMNMIHDIAREDSMNRSLYGLPDGSYLKIENGLSRFFGETWYLQGGKIRKICKEDASIELF